MSEYIHKGYNVTVFMYHLFFSAKYRPAVCYGTVKVLLRKIFLDIEKRYELKFLEIGAVDKKLDGKRYFGGAPCEKDIVGRLILVRRLFASTVGKHGDEQMAANYVKGQSNEYQIVYKAHQLALF